MADLNDKLNGKTNGSGNHRNKGMNGPLLFAILASALGSSFQHGYNTGVVNAPQTIIEEWINDTVTLRTGEAATQSKVTMIWSVAVSIFCVGGMIGGLITGLVADGIGRKNGLLANNIFVILASILEGLSKHSGSYEMIWAGRFFIGLASGLNAGLAPMYLAEISPVKVRGAVGTVYQLVITISILVSQVLGLSSVLGTRETWPTLLALTVVPGIFQLLTLPFCPESPKYLLVSQGREAQAQRALTWLRGTSDVQDEMQEMRSEYESSKSIPKVTVKEMLRNATLRIPLTIAVMIMIGQQLSGINAVMFFSTKIFKMAGLDDSSAQTATLAMGLVNVAMTVVSLFLVERAGRKTLLLTGFIGMFVDTGLLAICIVYADQSVVVSYISILLVLFFVITFAVGPGSIPWFLVTELFNQSARPTATSIAVGVNWTANFIVGIGFLPIQEVIGGYVFIIFTIILGLFSIFVWKKVPETKNKSIEEISAMFRQQSYN